MNQLISICLPVYNGGRYLMRTLESIVNQSYKDIEIIISDNASTDNTQDIVLSMQKDDLRIKYYRNDKNIGYSNNIKNAVLHASSEIIAIFHSDDLYGKNIIAAEYEILKSDKTIGAVFSSYSIFYNDNINKKVNLKIYKILKKLYNDKVIKNAFIGDYNIYLPILLKYGNIFACPTLMTKKSIFIELGGFQDKYPSNEDLELWIKYLQNGYKLAISFSNQFLYRISQEQSSSYWRKSTELPVIYSVIDDLVIENSNIEDNDLLAYKRNKASGYLYAAYNCYLLKYNKKMISLINESKNNYKFNRLSKYGFMQNYPFIYYYIKHIKHIKHIVLKLIFKRSYYE